MLLLALVAIFMLLGIVQPAHAMEVGVQDQGAATPVLVDVAENLGADAVRIIARPGEPHLDQVHAYREEGFDVQAAVLLKRWSTPNDVRQLMRAWHGQVRSVSIGNEPELNGLTPCAYASLYRRSYALVRREFPGTKIGFGELSPTDPIGYTTKVLACGQGGRDGALSRARRLVLPGREVRGRGRAAARSAGSGTELHRVERRTGRLGVLRRRRAGSARTDRQHRPLRADSWDIHAYQFHSDPLGPPAAERAMGAGIPSWMGIGSLGAAHRFLRAHRHQFSTPGGNIPSIRCTEFSYLVSGGYATTPARAAWMWPRAIKQARKWCKQLVIYGFGEVYPGSGWGSASLLDGFGQPTLAYAALAGALGRTLRVRKPAEPPVVVRTPLPDLSDTRPPIVELGEAASKDPEPPSVVVEEPAPAQDPTPPADEPPVPPAEPAPTDPTPVE